MNRETPELDRIGLFDVATAGAAPCSGYSIFYYRMQSEYTFYISATIFLGGTFVGVKKVRRYGFGYIFGNVLSVIGIKNKKN